MINGMFVALNSFDISTFNQFHFFKVTGYYSILRFPATLNVTHDAVSNSGCLQPQQKDPTAQHSPYTLHHRSFNTAAAGVGDILGRRQCQNTTSPNTRCHPQGRSGRCLSLENKQWTEGTALRGHFAVFHISS